MAVFSTILAITTIFSLPSFATVVFSSAESLTQTALIIALSQAFFAQVHLWQTESCFEFIEAIGEIMYTAG